MKYWEIIADNLSKAGWSWGCVSAMDSEGRTIWIAGLLISAAVERHPYSFYTLLRWICCPVFAYSAFAAHEKESLLWVWVFGVLAALYNPIFRVHLDRSTWIGVNWFTVGTIIVDIVAFLVREIQATKPITRNERR